MKPNKESRKISKIAKASVLSAVASLYFVSTTNTASAWGVSGALSWAMAQLRTEQQSDAIKTAVAQDAVGSAALAETIVMAKQIQVNTEANLLKKENLLDMYNNYISKGAITNNSRCVAVNQRRNEAAIPIKSQLLVKADLTNTISGGGFTDDISRLVALRDLKNNVACTLEQAKMGYCTPTLSGGQYLDVDFSMYLSSDRLIESQFIATKAGVMTIADTLMDGAIVDSCSSKFACSSYIGEQNNRVAVNSLVANSLLSQLYNRMAMGANNNESK